MAKLLYSVTAASWQPAGQSGDDDRDDSGTEFNRDPLMSKRETDIMSFNVALTQGALQ